MFQVNDLIIYGNTGVCRVKAVGPLEGVSSAKEDRIYYTLEPVYEKGTIYTPVDSRVFMRQILSPEEAAALIERIPVLLVNPIEASNTRVLSDQYDSFLSTHRCEDLVVLIRTVYMRNKKAEAAGKRPAQTDERYMKRAKELLHGELAAALGIAYEDVEDYIRQALSV